MFGLQCAVERHVLLVGANPAQLSLRLVDPEGLQAVPSFPPSGAVRDRAVREALRDPENHSRIQMGGKGHQLATVIVMRGFQPVSPTDLSCSKWPRPPSSSHS